MPRIPLNGLFSLLSLALALLMGCASQSGAAQPEREALSPSVPAPERPGVPSELPVDNLDPGAFVFDYFGGLTFDQRVPTPESVIGHTVGSRFTRHHDVMAYMRTLAEVSDRVLFERYGTTNQGRELAIVTISSPENLRNLSGILEANRELTDPETSDARVREIVRTNPAIVWFSYNVHGNEPSPTETSLQVAYTMAAGMNDEVQSALDNVVVVLDPMLNPDGRERYVSFLDNTMGSRVDTNPDGAEHDEPWPGGRTNHYLFDLNRDWIWLVQAESRQRLEVYRRYLPQLHLDYHEQEYRNPYFLGAGDTPANQNIPQATLEWSARYGDANAEVFDREGLVFSTRERFDYLYPGYGKTLPCYHGAVGLLLEQAGHSRGGLAIDLPTGRTLTLTERVRHHYLTSMNYIEATDAWRSEQLERFHEFFVTATELSEGADAAYILDSSNDPYLLARVWDWAKGHGVEIHRLAEDARLSGLHEYRDGSDVSTEVVHSGAWVLRADQPMGRLVTAMFERAPEIEDADTYDLTSWNLPVAFGLKAWYAKSPVAAPLELIESWSPESAGSAFARATTDPAPAMIIDGRQHLLPEAAAALMRKGVAARVAGEAFTLEDIEFSRGSLIVHRVDNPEIKLDALSRELSVLGLRSRLVATSMATDGPVLGANANRMWKRPKILVLRGQETSSLSFGQVWHMLDESWGIPHSIVNADTLNSVDLEDYSVIILPEGDAGRAIGGGRKDNVVNWIRSGGTLIALGRSGVWVNKEIAGAEDDAPPEPPEGTTRSDMRYAERKAHDVHGRVAGVTIGVELDHSHPLVFGLPDWLGVIKRSTRVLPVTDNAQVLARFVRWDDDGAGDEGDAHVDQSAAPVVEPAHEAEHADAGHGGHAEMHGHGHGDMHGHAGLIGGVISRESLQRIERGAYVTSHRVGSGRVIAFADDPTIRGFQHGPMRLLLNAILFGPSM